MCAPHLSDPFMARPGRALERSCGNAAWLRAEMAQLERRQSHFLSRGEHGCCGEKPTVSHVPQRCQDSKPSRDYLEKEVEEERSRDGIASLMKAADLGRIREEWRVRQFLLRSVPLRKLNEILAVPSRGFTGSSVQDLHSCKIQWQFFVQHIILSEWWKPLQHWLYQDRKFHSRSLQLITIKETTYYVCLHCVQGDDRSEPERNIHTHEV